MSVIEKSIEVDVPVRQVYNQWTQFEDFPQFMEGVERIEQLNDTTLRWHVSIAGVDREFEAHIEEQEPDRRVAWRATGDEEHAGLVTFEPISGDRTRVNVEFSWEPARWTDKVADALNLIDQRTEGDLERFKSFIEDRQGTPTGAWRGEVSGGQPQGGAGDVGGSTMGGSTTGVGTESGGFGDTTPIEGSPAPLDGGSGDPTERGFGEPTERA